MGTFDDTDPLLSTSEVIEAARRPLVVQRHDAAVRAALAGVDEAAVAQAPTDDPRAEALLRGLAADELLQSVAFGQALREHACLALENNQCQPDELPGLLAAAYASLRSLLSRHQRSGQRPCAELATIPGRRVHRLLEPIEGVGFGSRRLAESLVVTQVQADRILERVRNLVRPDHGDETWHESGGEPTLSREQEEPLQALPPAQRDEARRRLVADRIRHHFYVAVFLRYFDRDTMDPREVQGHATILDWLDAIEQTPHLFTFMQGQTASQKSFRLGQLWRKIVQINELAQRVSQASEHPTYRDAFQGLGTRQRLALLAKDRYPALRVDDAFLVATAACPFSAFAAWIQEKAATRDFVLPPEPR